MADPRFPDINRIADARSTFARTSRENALQPGRIERQSIENELGRFDIGTEEAKVSAGKRERGINERQAAGDPAAFGEMVRENPEEAKRQVDAIAAMRKLTKEQFEAGALQIGRFATVAAQLASEKDRTPEQIQADYTRLREALFKRNPEIRKEEVPEKFSAGFLKQAIAFASDLAALQKNAGFAQPAVKNTLSTVGVSGQPGAEQRVAVNPNTNAFENLGPPLVPSPPKASGSGSGGVGPGEIKSADTNTIKTIINELVGDFFDAKTGEIKVIDPDKRAQALAVLTEASRLFVEGGVTHAAAVTQAAELLELRIIKPPSNKRAGRDDQGPPSAARTKGLEAMEAFVNKLP